MHRPELGFYFPWISDLFFPSATDPICLLQPSLFVSDYYNASAVTV